MIMDHLMKLFKPEGISFMNLKKKAVFIEVTPHKQTCVIQLATFVIIGKDDVMDPENMCGVVEYMFKADLINNTYELLSFILKVDREYFDMAAEEFDPDSKKFVPPPSINLGTASPNAPSSPNLTAVGASTVYVAATPFILGALGGKKSKRKKTKKHNKTSRKKIKKHNKTKKRKKNKK